MPNIAKRLLLVVRTETRTGYVVKSKSATQRRKGVFSLIGVHSEMLGFLTTRIYEVIRSLHI